MIYLILHFVFFWLWVNFIARQESSQFYNKPHRPDYKYWKFSVLWPGDYWHWQKNLGLISSAMAWMSISVAWVVINGFGLLIIAGVLANLVIYWKAYPKILRL